jgi:hypothetical protein
VKPIWTKRFMKEQGYDLDENIFYQDNQSTIKIEKNGRKSCGPQSRHIDIRYFFIKDRLNSEGIVIEYCPTEQMLADFFTKPLQGGVFRRLRDVVMGHSHTDVLKTFAPDVPQERVGDRTNEHGDNDGRRCQKNVSFQIGSTSGPEPGGEEVDVSKDRVVSCGESGIDDSEANSWIPVRARSNGGALVRKNPIVKIS